MARSSKNISIAGALFFARFIGFPTSMKRGQQSILPYFIIRVRKTVEDGDIAKIEFVTIDTLEAEETMLE